MNALKLKSFMALNGDTGSTLSVYLGISPQRFSAKINERDGAEFTQSEILKIKDKYKLTAEDIEEIFFNN